MSEEKNNQDITQIDGIGQSKADHLKEIGFNTIQSISEASVDDLIKIKGIGTQTALKFINNAVEELNRLFPSLNKKKSPDGKEDSKIEEEFESEENIIESEVGEIKHENEDVGEIQHKRKFLEPDNFLNTLWDVVNEKSSFFKTQLLRIHNLWNEFWIIPDEEKYREFPKIEKVLSHKNEFYTNMENRIETLRAIQHGMDGGYLYVKTIVESMNNNIIYANLVEHGLSENDIQNLNFIIAHELFGTLLNFILMDGTEISLENLVVAKFKSLMKIRGITPHHIVKGLGQIGFEVEQEDAETALFNISNITECEIVEDESGNKKCKLVHNFEDNLSEEALKLYNKFIRPIDEWTVGLWRSLYNIRSLDTPIPETYPQNLSLREIVALAATQGYVNAQNVFENLVNYYKFIHEHDLDSP